MNKQDIIRKVTSKRFWAMVSGTAVSSMVLFNVDNDTIVKVVALIGQVANLAIYMLSEASVDKARAAADSPAETK